MNKNRYQQIMNRIQMPERCEQAILEQIAHNASPVPTRRTWKRNVIAGVAIAACISVIGMVSVSAIQGTNWIHQLFPNSSDDAATAQYASQQAGNVSAFSANLDDLDAELIAAFADESNLYYAVHLTPKTENPEKYTDRFTISQTGTFWFNGETNTEFLQGSASETRPDGDGYLFTNKIHLDSGTWENHMTYQAEMQAILYEGEQYETLKQNFGTIGTISITIDLQNKPQTSVYTASGTWNNASGFLNVEQVVLQPLTLTIDGTADNQTNSAKQVSVILKDGSTVAGEYMTSGYRNHGIVTEDLTQVEQFLYLEKPIDPTAATAIQMDDVTIPLTAKADNTILDPASMVATISNFTTTGMDDFTVTPLGVLSDGTNLAMVLNLAPNQPDMLPEETMCIIDVYSLNIDNKPLSELLSSESLNTVYAYSEQQADGTYTFTCKIQMDAFLNQQADVAFALKTSDDRTLGTVAFHLDNIQTIPSVTYTADGIWKHYVEIQKTYQVFHIQQVTCYPSHIKLAGKMDRDLVTQPESVSVILADGTMVSAVDLQSGKGGLSAGYGVSHNLDGTGWLEFDLPQPIDPNAVTYLKVDQTIIPLTAVE